jgi:hypothetical protein
LVIKACNSLTTLDASPAASLTSLRLENVRELQHVITPPGLLELTCVNLRSLSDLDLSRSQAVRANIQGCPAIRRVLSSILTIQP